jgi:hypothetical protein
MEAVQTERFEEAFTTLGKGGYNLCNFPVIPNSITIDFGGLVMIDVPGSEGGVLKGDGEGLINYETGAFIIFSKGLPDDFVVSYATMVSSTDLLLNEEISNIGKPLPQVISNTIVPENLAEFTNEFRAQAKWKGYYERQREPVGPQQKLVGIFPLVRTRKISLEDEA